MDDKNLARWMIAGGSILLAIGYIVFLCAIYARYAQTDNLARTFMRVQQQPETVTGEVISDEHSE